MQSEPTKERPDAMRQEIGVCYVLTSLDSDTERLYEGVYRQCDETENLIKLHKAQLVSDRTSCTLEVSNQFSRIPVTAAFWLMQTVRTAILEGHALAQAEFNTLRLKLLKIAVRVVDSASRIRAHRPTSCPGKALFRSLAVGLSS
jgi:hypothetical protein